MCSTVASSSSTILHPPEVCQETALLFHHYQICDIIEKNPFYTIYRAVQRSSGLNFMVKSVDLTRLKAFSAITQDDLESEVEITATLKHSHFVQLKDVIAGSNAFHMVFEWIDGQDICFEIVRRAATGYIYSEQVCSHYIRQLVGAIQHMHSLDIVHRDIRPHNLLLANKENNAPLKIRGLGLAFKLSPDGKYTSGKVGNASFMAPEILTNQPYGKTSDMWNVGILLYLMLCGRLPFIGRSTDELHRKIIACDFTLAGPIWNEISDRAKDLIKNLLVADKNTRFTPEQCLQHEWICNKNVPSKSHLHETIENLRRYNNLRKLKTNVLSTLNSSKWCSINSNEDQREGKIALAGGGDTCEFELKPNTTDLSNSTASSDQSSENVLLNSLDKLALLCDLSNSSDQQMLNSILSDNQFRNLLWLYDRIRMLGLNPSTINVNADKCLNEATEELSACANKTPEIVELISLLNTPHIRSLFLTQSVVVDEVYASPIPPGLFTYSSCCPKIESPDNVVLEIEASQKHMPQGQGQLFKGQPLKDLQPLTPKEAICVATNKVDSIKAEVPNGSVCTGEQRTSRTPTVAASSVQSNTETKMARLLCKDAEPSTSHDIGYQPFVPDDDDDLMLNAVSRVRIVQFQKIGEEAMGITLKINEDGRCFVGRIMHGGLIHRQATLHVGDEICEINGSSVASQKPASLQKMLREARGIVTFKICPSYRSAPPACEIFVRAQFDYDPSQDDLIPCTQAGVLFKIGDILQIISKDDHNWWQARFVSSFPGLISGGGSANKKTNVSTFPHCANAVASTSAAPMTNHLNQSSAHVQQQRTNVAGLIPSPELQEWRTACLAMEQNREGSSCLWFGRKKKYYTTKYLRRHSEVFDQLDLRSYEEVVRLPSFRRKTLVLLGAHGVGRRHIKNTLIRLHSNRFAYPIPHTTRPPKRDEIDGKHYFFVSTDTMIADIQTNEYLEYGTHEEFMYGTKLETIRAIHRAGKMAILDIEPQALKVIRNAEYSPFVIFIAAPPLECLDAYKAPDGSLEKLVRESEELRLSFGHFFDYVICNNDIDDTIQQLEVVVEKLNAISQWVPVSWIY